MQEAIRLSIENVEKGNGGPFGAVVVKDGKIIARGVNNVTSHNDPTAHARYGRFTIDNRDYLVTFHALGRKDNQPQRASTSNSCCMPDWNRSSSDNEHNKPLCNSRNSI